ncbi:MAG: hypothetical protein V4631_14625 [Pseudomonadota bacterium]
MDPRISTLESDVAAMRAFVETIHSNYATNIALVETEARLRLEIVSAKNELNLKFVEQITALDYKIEKIAAEQRLEFQKIVAEQKLEFQNVASEMRNWLVATIIGLFVGFGGLFIGLARIVKP